MTPAVRAILFGGKPDSRAQLWANTVQTNGGTVSPARLRLVSKLIRALDAGGSWALDDDLWMLCAENATQALTSIKQRRLATPISTPTFGVDTGYVFNGSTTAINAGFIPSTHAVAMTATSNRLGVYERTSSNMNAYAAGSIASTNRVIRIAPRNSGNVIHGANDGNGTFTLVSATSLGFTAGSRNGADTTTCLAYKNAVSLTRTVDPTTFGATLPDVALYLGGYNSAGVLTLPRPCTLGFAVIGAALSAAQELAEYNAIQAHMTALGAQV